MLKIGNLQQQGNPTRTDDEQLANAGDGYHTQARSGGELRHAAERHKAGDAHMLEAVNLQQKGTPTRADDV